MNHKSFRLLSDIVSIVILATLSGADNMVAVVLGRELLAELLRFRQQIALNGR